MIGIMHLTAVLAAVFFYVLYQKYIAVPQGEMPSAKEGENRKNRILFLLLLGAGLLVRLVAAGIYEGHPTDMNCFIAWGDMAYKDGISSFYASEAFTDYPPGYIYVLYLQGMLRSLFSLEPFGVGNRILVKLPAVLCDLGIAAVIYQIASKRSGRGKNAARALMCLWLFHPVSLMDSAIWGQVDSVFTLFVLLMCLCMTGAPSGDTNMARNPAINKETPSGDTNMARNPAINKETPSGDTNMARNPAKKYYPLAYFVFAIGILIKPQTLVFAPVLFAGAVREYITAPLLERKKETRDASFWKEYRRSILYQLLYGAGAILLMVLLALPFGIGRVVSQYTETLGSYPYASTNAYNFWTMLGKNWSSQEECFLGISYEVYGKIFLVLIVALVVFLIFKKSQTPSIYFFAAGLLNLLMFAFSVRMHERYMYPAVVFFLVAWVYTPGKKLFLMSAALSILNFYNLAYVLFCYDYQNFRPFEPLPIVVSVLIVAESIWFIWYAFSGYGKERENPSEKIEAGKNQNDGRQSGKTKEMEGTKTDAPFRMGKRMEKFTKFDWIALSVIVLVYSCAAFYDLGDRTAPESAYEVNEPSQSITLDFGRDVSISKISYFLGPYEKRLFSVWIRKDGEKDYEQLGEDMEMTSVFAWGSYEAGFTAREVFLGSGNEKFSIKELAFWDSEGNLLVPVNADAYPGLFDEQALVPERATFRNGTYFDEIYHARTAYEYIHGLYCYENTHPPLGKVFISFGIRMFGMNPFGWRFMGTLFGILMLPVLYVFVKRMFGGKLPVIATTLFAFDFMHFAQTRIATIDVFVTFFIMASYYFMYRYKKMNFFESGLKKTFLPLAFCGIMMGMGIAVKWTGIYSAAGLCVLFFHEMYLRFREYAYAKKNPGKKSGIFVHDVVVKQFPAYFWKTIGFCVIFFILVPAVIYFLSYLPFSDGSGADVLTQLINNQNTMFSYHSQLVSEHPFSSTWYQWPSMYRPIWYYSSVISDTVAEGISAFGNPLVWWAGIPAFAYMLYRFFYQKDKKAMFLVVGYLAQYLPWVLVSRTTYIYHYFPSVPFVVLMIACSIQKLTEKRPKLIYAAAGYTIAAVALFALFYPVLSGQPVEKQFVTDFLRWFDSWVLLST